MDEEEGLGWSLEFTKQIASEYKRYLILCIDSEIWASSKRCPNCGRSCRNSHGYFIEERPTLQKVA